MARSVVWLLQALLALFFAVSVLVQVWVIPSLARDVAVHYPFLAHLEVVGVVGPVLMVLCAQIVLVCLWALSSMAAAGRVFRRSAFRFVDVVIAALAAFAVLSLAALVLCAANDALAPGNVLVLGGGMLGSFAAALLVVIMRGLLVTATRLEQDLAEVI